MKLITAPLSRKAQLTVPKTVRKALGLKGEEGELVGFLLDEVNGTAKLTKVEGTPVGEAYTEAELRALRALGKGPGKSFRTMKALINSLDD